MTDPAKGLSAELRNIASYLKAQPGGGFNLSAATILEAADDLDSLKLDPSQILTRYGEQEAEEKFVPPEPNLRGIRHALERGLMTLVHIASKKPVLDVYPKGSDQIVAVLENGKVLVTYAWQPNEEEKDGQE